MCCLCVRNHIIINYINIIIYYILLLNYYCNTTYRPSSFSVIQTIHFYRWYMVDVVSMRTKGDYFNVCTYLLDSKHEPFPILYGINRPDYMTHKWRGAIQVAT